MEQSANKLLQAVEALKGCNFTDPTTLEKVMNALEQDFDLRFGVPGGMATYRKSLALGFFYRFYHEILAEVTPGAKEIDQQAFGELERDISFGYKDHTVGEK